jgi:hypothetical protein
VRPRGMRPRVWTPAPRRAPVGLRAMCACRRRESRRSEQRRVAGLRIALTRSEVVSPRRRRRSRSCWKRGERFDRSDCARRLQLGSSDRSETPRIAPQSTGASYAAMNLAGIAGPRVCRRRPQAPPKSSGSGTSETGIGRLRPLIKTNTPRGGLCDRGATRATRNGGCPLYRKWIENQARSAGRSPLTSCRPGWMELTCLLRQIRLVRTRTPDTEMMSWNDGMARNGPASGQQPIRADPAPPPHANTSHPG